MTVWMDVFIRRAIGTWTDRPVWAGRRAGLFLQWRLRTDEAWSKGFQARVTHGQADVVLIWAASEEAPDEKRRRIHRNRYIGETNGDSHAAMHITKGYCTVTKPLKNCELCHKTELKSCIYVQNVKNSLDLYPGYGNIDSESVKLQNNRERQGGAK